MKLFNIDDIIQCNINFLEIMQLLYYSITIKYILEVFLDDK